LYSVTILVASDMSVGVYRSRRCITMSGPPNAADRKVYTDTGGPSLRYLAAYRGANAKLCCLNTSQTSTSLERLRVINTDAGRHSPSTLPCAVRRPTVHTVAGIRKRRHCKRLHVAAVFTILDHDTWPKLLHSSNDGVVAVHSSRIVVINTPARECSLGANIRARMRTTCSVRASLTACTASACPRRP
jgi:hypothetical protein